MDVFGVHTQLLCHFGNGSASSDLFCRPLGGPSGEQAPGCGDAVIGKCPALIRIGGLHTAHAVLSPAYPDRESAPKGRST